MFELNLPEFDVKVRKEGEKSLILDPLRKRWVALTPEEWVRQHFVHFMVYVKGYPQGRMANEYGVQLNGMSLRCDTVFFDAAMNPAVVIEYKAPTVPITQKVFDQAFRYNVVLKPALLIVSNGLQHHCCRVDTIPPFFMNEIPSFSEFSR